VSATIKRLRLRRPDTCTLCGGALAIGDQAAWDKEARVITCLPCLDGAPEQVAAPLDVEAAQSEDDVLEISAPGASLEREYEQRVAARDKRVRERHPRMGRFLLALTPEPQSTKAFAVGAGDRRQALRRREGRRGGDRWTVRPAAGGEAPRPGM